MSIDETIAQIIEDKIAPFRSEIVALKSQIAALSEVKTPSQNLSDTIDVLGIAKHTGYEARTVRDKLTRAKNANVAMPKCANDRGKGNGKILYYKTDLPQIANILWRQS